MSNAYIPDQLDQLSKKELVETAKIMHETNVDLAAQLAKANKRAEEAEKELNIAVEYIEQSGVDYDEATEHLHEE